jgi:Uracil DNA glycosylase superfamily
VIEKHQHLIEASREFLACRDCYENPDIKDDLYNYYDNPVTGEKMWAPPRGWAGQPSQSVDFLFVAMNPGHPVGDEIQKYVELGIVKKLKTGVSFELAKKASEISLNHYQDPLRDLNGIFHKNSRGYARSLLWLLDGKYHRQQVLQRCWFTDLVKCSTRKESPRSGIIKDAFQNCRRHLKKEIEICSPKLIVALGKQAEYHLNTLIEEEHIDHPMVRLRHPSNGCPRLYSEYHDIYFKDAAKKLKVSEDIVISDEFRKIRKEIWREEYQRSSI